MTDKVAILTAGRGTRMQAAAPNVSLSREQQLAADAGAKAMIPIGRPFLDYTLSACADAGFRDVCLIIAPGANPIRDHYSGLETTRLRLHYAVQEQPLGVANAVLSVREFVGEDAFVVINGDNYYPASVLEQLRRMPAPALPAYSRAGLLREGQIAAERILAYALLDIDGDGCLRRIVEKPTAAEAAAMPNAPVSLNSWLFTPSIFDACERVQPSARGELELPAAVQLAIDSGMRFSTFSADASVLDLSSRADIPAVAERLRTVRVHL